MNIELNTRFILASLTITPDTCTSIQFGYNAEATTHPVEDGSTIADHVIRKPPKVSFVTTWTPRPIDDTYLPQGNDRGLEAFQILSATLQSRQPIQIITDGQNYENMVLQSVTMPRAFEDGDGRTITIECQQIQIVSGQTVKIRVSKAGGFKGKAKRKRTNVTLTRGQAAAEAAASLFTGDFLRAAGFTYIAVK